MQSMTAAPRSACGASNSQKPQSAVTWELSHRLEANSVRPAAITLRGSARWESHEATTTDATWATPAVSTVTPICRLS